MLSIERVREALRCVAAYRDGKRFISCIRVSGRNVHLGIFHTPEAAHAAYASAAVRFFGEFARAA